MKTESQMQILLEWMGWKFQKGTEPTYGGTNIQRGWINPANGRLNVNHPPLTLDLMFDAEDKYLKSCTCVDQKSLWLDVLGCVVGWVNANNPTDAKFECDLNSTHATKEQRLEALLKTIGRWTDGKSEEKEMRDIYSMTVKELEDEKRRHEGFIREIKRLIRVRLKTPPNEEVHSDERDA